MVIKIFRNQSEEKNFSKILTEDHGSVKLNTFEFDDFDTLTNEFHYSYDFTIQNHISKTAGLNIFEIPWADAINSMDMVSDEDREYPVELCVDLPAMTAVTKNNH